MIDAENWSWETLHTYEAVLAELDPAEEPVVDGAQWLLQQHQKHGG